MTLPVYLTGTQETTKSSLKAAKALLAQGMSNQQLLARIAAENFTNAKTTSHQPGGDPYRRKVVSFETMMDRQKGLPLLAPDKIGFDNSPFKIVHKPFHPAADARGYVKMPNVDEAVEMIDFREANQATNAMAQIYALATAMETRNHDLMKKV